MGLLADAQIAELCTGAEKMIDPFEPRQVREWRGMPALSYGLSSAGYDIRLAREFRIFDPAKSAGSGAAVIDPKAMKPELFELVEADACTIPPHSYVLGASMETFRMPADVMGIVIGKSTLARCGIILNITPLEPGWKGVLTLEIGNATPMPVVLRAWEGVGQVLFVQTDRPPRGTYVDRAGKYQDQAGVTLAKV